MARPFALLAFVVIAANAATAEAVQGNTAAMLPPMSQSSPVQVAIHDRIMALSGDRPITVSLPAGTLSPGQEAVSPVALGTRAGVRDSLARFYTARAFRPAWTGVAAAGRLQRLVLAIDDSASQGLRPARYHQAMLQRALDGMTSGTAAEALPPGAQADLDLAASDAFLTLASDYMSGRVRPQSFDPEWTIQAPPGDPVPLLQQADTTGDVAAALQAGLPRHPGYQELLSVLSRLREMAEGGAWPQIPAGPSLKPGMFDSRVAVLRSRLTASGDLGRPAAPAGAGADTPAAIRPDAGLPALPEAYEGELVAAVLHFQRRHGLEPDGVVGPKTLAALNVSLADRIRQVELNLERWRWLPADLGRRYVLVNIAGQDYRLVEDGVERLHGRTIVGGAYRSTPVFSDEIEYLVFNPKWTVPRKLAVEDKLPQIRKDPDFLRREGFTVYTGWGESAVEIQPEYIDWHGLSKDYFPYRLVQAPGDLNALGRVKFLFPNKYDVYLHDTPSRHLFERATRTFSSGCIRVEHPLLLAEYLLQTERGWDRDRIDGALEQDNERWIRLREPVPVHLLHWTAWRDPDGTMQFRSDLYGRDSRLSAALAHASR